MPTPPSVFLQFSAFWRLPQYPLGNEHGVRRCSRVPGAGFRVSCPHELLAKDRKSSRREPEESYVQTSSVNPGSLGR